MKKLSLFLVVLLLYTTNSFFCVAYAQNSNRDSWQQPEKIMDVVGIKEGMIIGEAGAGKGYFTFYLSKRVGKSGKVYANDIKKDVLEKIATEGLREQKRARRWGIFFKILTFAYLIVLLAALYPGESQRPGIKQGEKHTALINL